MPPLQQGHSRTGTETHAKEDCGTSGAMRPRAQPNWKDFCQQSFQVVTMDSQNQQKINAGEGRACRSCSTPFLAVGGVAGPRQRQIFKRQGAATLLCGLHQFQIIARWDRTALLPCRNGRIWPAQVGSQIRQRRPYVKNVFHTRSYAQRVMQSQRLWRRGR